MKAWYVSQRGERIWAHNRETGEDCRVKVGVHIPAETRGRAKASGASEMNVEFVEVGAERIPRYDGLTADEMYRRVLQDDPWEV